ncbi:MAG: hypothetical protein AAGD35_23795, partial [Actinomycetota bacterium]
AARAMTSGRRDDASAAAARAGAGSAPAAGEGAAEPWAPAGRPGAAWSAAAAEASSRRPLVIALAAVVALVVVGGLAVVAFGGDDQPTDVADDAASDVAAPSTEQSSGSTAPETTVGRPTEGPIDVAELEVGDCIEIDLGLGLTTAAQLVPCAEPHNAEVVATFVPGDGSDAFPGRTALLDEGFSRCSDEFLAYTGTQPLASLLGSVAVRPTFTEWTDETRRSIVCLATAPPGDRLTESVAGRGSVYALYEGATTTVDKLVGSTCFDAESDSIESFGKRQLVTTVGCTNLHRFEVYAVDAVPADEDLLAEPTLSPDALQSLFDGGEERCGAAWDELTLPDELPEPTVIPVLPDEVDWRLGDRLLVCVARWDEPLVGSVLLLDTRAGATGDG